MENKDGGSADVLIIGAGFAGLTAARILSAYGARPLIVEARQRLGGRASTAEFPASPEQGIHEPDAVEEGCNYLHGCSSDHPLFLLAARLGLPTAVAAGDLGFQYSGWESAEIADWHDPEKPGEPITLDDIVHALLLLQHIVEGVACLAMQKTKLFRKSLSSDLGKPSEKMKCDDDSESVEELFQHAVDAVLKRRMEAGKRSTSSLTKREHDMIRKIRGRHFGFVSPCTRMSPETLVASTTWKDAHRVFMDGSWPESDPALMDGIQRLLRRKFEFVKELGSQGPEKSVVSEPNDEGEDRLVLGGGFQVFIEALAKDQEILLGEPVRSVSHSSDSVTVTLKSGRVLRASHCIVTVPSGVLAGLSPESTIDFVPPLPEEKLQAIRRLSIPSPGACTHEKVVLRWSPAEPFVQAILDPPGAALQIETTDRRFHFLNLHKYGRSGQLLCHIWADAEWHEHASLTDQEVVAAVVGGLQAIFPCDPRHIESSSDSNARSMQDTCQAEFVSFPPQWKVTRWSKDPFAMGAYTELQSPNASEADRQIYARPEGQLLFTGEGAVSGNVGAQCTHGAVLGGAKAALTLLSQGVGRKNRESKRMEERVSLGQLLGDGPLDLNVEAIVEVLVTGNCNLKRRREQSCDCT